MKKEFWWWVGVGLFTVIAMAIMTGIGIRDGDWAIEVASLFICAVCFIVQMYNIVKLVEGETRLETLTEMREWLHGCIKESEPEEETSDPSRLTESEA